MTSARISVTIDDAADTAYITFSDRPVARTKEFDDIIMIDLDEYDMVVGVELLDTAYPVPFDELMEQYHIDGKAVDILRAIATQPKLEVSASAHVRRVAETGYTLCS